MATESKTEELLGITESALTKIIEIRDGEDDADTLGLRISVTGINGVEYAYDLAFESVAETDDTDVRYTVGDLTVMLPADDIDKLRGATLDIPNNPVQGGLVIRNPNRPNPLGDLGPLELTGSLAEKVTALLEQRINPSLASHGGFASLVGVDGDKVYVTMGGGCQGCSMSAITLTEGIRAAIIEALPEVSEVLDATDHTAGENPFYT